MRATSTRSSCSAKRAWSQGRKADAVAIFQRVIQTILASGQKPQENVYKRTLGVAYEASLPASVELGRQWAAAYPSADSWHTAVGIYRNMMRPDDESSLALLRLLGAANSLTGTDYNDYAAVAIDQTNFVEAQAVLHQGVAANRIKADDAVIAKALAALKTKPTPTDADLMAAAKSAPKPDRAAAGRRPLLRAGSICQGGGHLPPGAGQAGRGCGDGQSSPGDGAGARRRQGRGDGGVLTP